MELCLVGNGGDYRLNGNVSFGGARRCHRNDWTLLTLEKEIVARAPTRAHRVWTARILRTSRRMGCSGGLANWRLRSGKKLIDRTLSEECSYRRPMANSGR
jgi:hypothetical protein